MADAHHVFQTLKAISLEMVSATKFWSLASFCFLSYSAGNGTQDLAHARQILYH